jgi:hypothetical protein
MYVPSPKLNAVGAGGGVAVLTAVGAALAPAADELTDVCAGAVVLTAVVPDGDFGLTIAARISNPKITPMALSAVFT